jgi:hypothetical protein
MDSPATPAPVHAHPARRTSRRVIIGLSEVVMASRAAITTKRTCVFLSWQPKSRYQAPFSALRPYLSLPPGERPRVELGGPQTNLADDPLSGQPRGRGEPPEGCVNAGYEGGMFKPSDDFQIFFPSEIAQVSAPREIAERIKCHDLASRKYLA